MNDQLTPELTKLRDLIAELVQVPAVHCHEERMMVECRDRFGAFADEVVVDVRGNCHATFNGTGETDLTLMLAAHMDGNGLIVKWIDEKGFIRFDGNAMGQTISSRRVWIHGSKEPVLGVTSTKLGYGITPAEESTKTPRLQDMYIDVGCSSREEVEALGIGIGDPATYGGTVETLGSPFRVVGPVLDDRAGVAVLLALAEQLQDLQPRPKVVLVGTVEEEVGTRGAEIAAAIVEPDVAISIDTQPAGGTPDVPEHVLPLDIGKGPVIKTHEGRFVAMVHPRVRQLLESGAEAAGEPYQLAGTPPGSSDMRSIQQVGKGIATGALALPRRFAHAPNEVIDLRDALGMVSILKESIRILGGGYSLARV